MRKRIALLVTSALALMVMLVPASSAQGAFREDPFCVPSGQHEGSLLAPGRACTSYPLNINEIRTFVRVGNANASGSVCLGLTQFGGSNHGQPVAGVPGINCWRVRDFATGFREIYTRWVIWGYNPYMRYSHRYGQARIMNLSSTNVRVIDYGYNRVTHWLP